MTANSENNSNTTSIGINLLQVYRDIIYCLAQINSMKQIVLLNASKAGILMDKSFHYVGLSIAYRPKRQEEKKSQDRPTQASD
jgi:hypothetical protein